MVFCHRADEIVEPKNLGHFGKARIVLDSLKVGWIVAEVPVGDSLLVIECKDIDLSSSFLEGLEERIKSCAHLFHAVIPPDTAIGGWISLSIAANIIGVGSNVPMHLAA